MDKFANMSFPIGLQTITKEKIQIVNQKGSGKKKKIKIIHRTLTAMPKYLL